MTTFVLVPGFWLGSWAWDEVAARLRADGHEVVAVTPGGVAERAAERDATIESQVADLVALLREHRDVVLVGHSGAGVVIAAAAERARDRVARLVYVDTGPLPEGMAQIDFVPPEVADWTRAQIAANDGRQPMPTREQFEKNGASTAGIDDETFARVHARSTPEPGGVVTGTARRATPDPTLPKTVIACSFTEADARGAVAAGVVGFGEMGGPEWSFVELPTGHWPMFSRPVELAERLLAISEDG
ncbi:alpha/beta fold hydrolase [Pseudonocardia acaciae]|uniref:alpha/beta fold hydrolase n=1 Tax=Pseudonocardia acaciae TaxID=551276 RepID=UPI00048F782C|nr:alpha/beta hydrolase [Pseudonocardia acaciae]